MSDDKDMAGSQIVFVAPPSSSTLIDPIISGGRWLKPGDENAVVIGNQLQNMFSDLKLGDSLTIKINDKETQWRIIGFYTITGNTDVPLIYTNYEYISHLIGQPGMVYSLRVLTREHDAITQGKINDQLLANYEARGIRVSSTRLSADFVRNQTASTDIFVYFMLVMASLIAVVGGLGLMGTMGINVLERTREIGVMRAIGASNWDIQSIVIVEGIVIGLISWLISIFLAIPITNILCFGVGMAIGIIAWLIFMLMLATIASALPARRASHLTVRDTLVYE
jgi:putative ABC transport system permease protein